MYYEKQERELHLKDVIFAVLHQWRKILVLALVFALLLGGMKAVSVWQKNGQSVDQTAYQQELEVYQQTKAYKEREIQWLQEKILRQRTYMQESLLMNLDSTDMYRGAMDFYIADADEMYVQRMLETYRSALVGAEFMDAMAAELGLESKYLRELVSISTKESTVGEQTRQYVNVVFNYNGLEGVTLFLERVNARLDEMVAGVTGSLGSHTLVRVAGPVGKCVDNASVAASQWTEKERLTRYDDSLSGAKKALDELTVPANPAASGDVTRSAVKFAVVGGLLGGVLGAVWALAMILFGDRLYSATDLQGRYRVKLLGTVAGGKKRFVLDKWLDTLEGRVTEDTAQNDALLAANLRGRCADAELLLCGDAEAAKRIAGRIGNALAPVTVLETGDPVKELDALERLQQARSVALVAVCGKERYSHMAKTMDLMQDLGKEFIGCIIVEN